MHDGIYFSSQGVGTCPLNDASNMTTTRPDQSPSSHLQASFTQKLISRPERYLNDSSKFRQLPCCIVLDIGDTLTDQIDHQRQFNSGHAGYMTYFEIANQLLHNCLPRDEPLNQDIAWLQILRGDILLDKTLIP